MEELTEDKPLWLKTIVLIGLVFLCAILGSALLLGVAAIGGMELSSDMDVFSEVTNVHLRPYIKAGIGLNHLAMFALSSFIFSYWLKGAAWKSYFKTAEIDIDLMMKLVLLLFLSYPLIGLSAMALEHVDLPQWADSMDESSIDDLMKMLQMDGVGDLIVNLIIIAIIPAVGEELLFRGVIQNELVKKMVNPHVAIFIASAIFSGFHLQVQGFLPKLVIGMVLGYAYYWTKSIWYPIILHFLNNGLQTLILFFSGGQLAEAEETIKTPETSQFVIVVIISCFLCYLLIKNIKLKISERNINIYEQSST